MSVFVDGHVQLDSQATMFAVLDELSDATTYPAGYRGTVSFDPGGFGWRLEIGKQGAATAVVDNAAIGDHLAFFLGKLMHATDAEYQGVE